VNGRTRLWLIASRDIAKGEQITVTYRFGIDGKSVKCKCGEAKCRSTIHVSNKSKVSTDKLNTELVIHPNDTFNTKLQLKHAYQDYMHNHRLNKIENNHWNNKRQFRSAAWDELNPKATKVTINATFSAVYAHWRIIELVVPKKQPVTNPLDLLTHIIYTPSDLFRRFYQVREAVKQYGNNERLEDVLADLFPTATASATAKKAKRIKEYVSRTPSLRAFRAVKPT
jgi:hypothetical protein